MAMRPNHSPAAPTPPLPLPLRPAPASRPLMARRTRAPTTTRWRPTARVQIQSYPSTGKGMGVTGRWGDSLATGKPSALYPSTGKGVSDKVPSALHPSNGLTSKQREPFKFCQNAYSTRGRLGRRRDNCACL